MLFKVVQVYVKNDKPKRAEVAGTTFYSAFCNPNMFKCHSYVICIPKHYVCDGKPDCKDQSDESWEICDGDPCRGKYSIYSHHFLFIKTSFQINCNAMMEDVFRFLGVATDTTI